MQDIKEMLNQSLNESRTDTKQIAAYLESWVKGVPDQREMYNVLGAIVEGLKAGLVYREDPEYLDDMDDKYKKATDALKTFVGQLK